MDNSAASSSSGSGAEGPSSFFDMATNQEFAERSGDRVQELKRILFDLAYLVMNADGNEHISEKMLVRELQTRIEREGSVDVETRTGELARVLDDGPGAIRERVLDLADEVADRAGDRVADVGDGYLDFLKGLIVSDASIADEEYELFNELCDRWGVEKQLPRS